MDNELLMALSGLLDEKFKPVNEKVDRLEVDIQEMKGEIQGVKEDIQEMKGEIQGVKEDVQEMKGEIQGVKEDMKSLDERLTSELLKTNVLLENRVLPQIKLLAENFVPAATKYEVAITELRSMKADIDVLKIAMEGCYKYFRLSEKELTTSL